MKRGDYNVSTAEPFHTMPPTIQITESYKPVLERLELELHSEFSRKRIGRDVVAVVQDNFRELRRNKRKFPTTHFWQRAAEATSYRVEGDDVVVSVDQIGIRQRFLGGAIRPIRGKYLTIPAMAATYGHTASDFNDLKVVRGQFMTYWGRKVSLALVPSHWEEGKFNPANTLGNDPSHLSYDCRFKTSGGLSTVLPQLDAPTITRNGAAYTLTCGTSGAAIFYTLDGSNPSPRNGTFYSAPFTPATGLTLNARAWLAGYLASDLSSATT